jgi:hypothetical protein
MILLSRTVPPRAQNIGLFCYWRLDGETFVKQHRGIAALVDRPPVIVEFASCVQLALGSARVSGISAKCLAPLAHSPCAGSCRNHLARKRNDEKSVIPYLPWCEAGEKQEASDDTPPGAKACSALRVGAPPIIPKPGEMIPVALLSAVIPHKKPNQIHDLSPGCSPILKVSQNRTASNSVDHSVSQIQVVEK